MFGRHFEFGEDKWRGRHGWRGRGFGGRHGMGGGDFMRARRMLAQGDLRLIALGLIAEQPRHGYEIIKVLEEKEVYGDDLVHFLDAQQFVKPEIDWTDESVWPKFMNYSPARDDRDRDRDRDKDKKDKGGADGEGPEGEAVEADRLGKGADDLRGRERRV